MTPFDKVIDLALITVDDYKLLKLYNQSEVGFKKWCDGFLISAIPNFFRCRQSLEYDTITREFVSDLTTTEISILADLWIIEWFNRETQNSVSINALLQSGSFKTHSAAQNLKEKGIYLDAMWERVNQKITDYQLQDIDSISI